MSSSSSSQIEEALEFDIAILQMVLQRNRNQHHRALYYRRLEMVLRSIIRYPIIGTITQTDIINKSLSVLVEEVAKSTSTKEGETEYLGLSDTISYLREKYNHMVSIVNRQRSKQSRSSANQFFNHSKQDDNYKWTIQSPSTSSNPPIFQSPLIKYIKQLHILLCHQIPEILSRIKHASSALFIELSRGYFVPLCTVALGCISRIRTILIKLAMEGCVQYPIMTSFLQRDYETYIQCHYHNKRDQEDGATMDQILIKEAKIFLTLKEYENSHVEKVMKTSFVEMDDGQFHSQMNKNLYSELRRRFVYSSNRRFRNKKIKSYPSNNNNDDCIEGGRNDVTTCKMDIEVDGVASPSMEDVEDIIGEQIDFTFVQEANNNNNNQHVEKIDFDIQEKDNGDKNLEIVQLLKEQKIVSKHHGGKKRIREENQKRSDKVTINKKAKDNHCSNESVLNRDDTLSSKKKNKKTDKKKKDKKKKTKKKKDVIDDIFGGF